VSECPPYQSQSQSHYLPIIDIGAPFYVDFKFDFDFTELVESESFVYRQNANVDAAATSDTPANMDLDDHRARNDPTCDITIHIIPPSTPSAPYDELAYEEPEIIFYPESELVDWELTWERELSRDWLGPGLAELEPLGGEEMLIAYESHDEERQWEEPEKKKDLKDKLKRNVKMVKKTIGRKMNLGLKKTKCARTRTRVTY
jgi:hypothetical protein